MTTIGQNDDPHARLKLPPQSVKLVIDQLPIVAYPGFIHPIVLVVISVIDLTAMTGISQKEHIAGFERFCGCENSVLDRVSCGLLG